MKKRKIVAAALAGTLAVTALLAGTYAWRSMNQQARNEVLVKLNPGGRLHDDFNGLRMSDTETNVVKNVYVENFTDKTDSAKIYARIRLDEYMEIGTGAGRDDDSNKAKPLVGTNPDTTKEVKRDDKTTWVTYKWGESDFRKYIQLNKGGSTIYLPTFNKNKDSLEAQINGTLAGVDGVAYKDYEKYETSKPKTSIEIWSVDSDNTDELADKGFTVDKFIEEVGKANLTKTTQSFTATPDPAAGATTAAAVTCTVTKVETVKDSGGNETGKVYYVDMEDPSAQDADGADIKIVVNEEHTPKSTIEITKDNVITMAQWKSADTSNGGKNSEAGPYWVCDTDGWAYWAQPIEPDTATGCLINSIQCADKTKLSSEYYYALNVVAQFATAGDWGDATKGSETGFYVDGMTDDALDLLYTVAGMESNVTAMALPELVKDTALNDKVSIDGAEYYVVYKDADNTKALLWAVNPTKGYVATSGFGATVLWKDSYVREYLDTEFVKNNPTIQSAIKLGIIPTTTNYTRSVYTEAKEETRQETQDEIFLLSEPDIQGFVYGANGELTAEAWEYTTGTGAKLGITEAMRKSDVSEVVATWLRSPRHKNEGVAKLNGDTGYVTTNQGITKTNAGVRPAFWVNLPSAN